MKELFIDHSYALMFCRGCCQGGELRQSDLGGSTRLSE